MGDRIQAKPAKWRDISGTVTTGGTAQALSAGLIDRAGFWVQNNSSGDLWIRDGGSVAAAAQPSLKITAGQLYESPITGVPSGSISIFGATTGQAFTAREW